MTTETIRLEVESMGRPPKVIEFQGRIIEHHEPLDLVMTSVDGFTSTAKQAGEFLIVSGLPSDFDYDAGWNVIACPTLGSRHRYFSQTIGRERNGAARFRLNVE